MSQSLFECCKQDFVSDGALKDIYILESNLIDWQQALNVAFGYPITGFFVDRNPQSPISTAQDIFSLRPNASPQLNFDIGGIDIACHFFDSTEIEFDFVPNQITSIREFESLTSFIERLGVACGKPVLVSRP